MTTENTAKKSGKTFKFGVKEAADSVTIKTAKNGSTYADYKLKATTPNKTFDIYGRVFDAGVIAAMVDAAPGTEIRVGGFVESNVGKNAQGEERTYLRLLTDWVRIGKGEGEIVVKAQRKQKAEATEGEAAAA